MKLRNKKTGEIMDDVQYRNYSTSDGFGLRMDGKEWEYHSLAELNEDWEDYEEPKEHWYINYQGEVYVLDPKAVPEYSRNAKSIGNHFETREEAEKAVEKLKAWKRLKDKGFKFDGWYGGSRIIQFRITSLDEDGDCLPHFVDNDTKNDIDLLFGGEE